MTGADLQWSEVEVTALGVNEGADKRILPPGQLTAAVNCDFQDARGSVKKRPGTQKLCDGPQDPLLADLSLSRLAVHERTNQLLGVDLSGGSDQVPALYSIPTGAAGTTVRPSLRGYVSSQTIRRKPIFTDLESDIITDCAYVDNASGEVGYMVYGSVRPQSKTINIKIVRVERGTNVNETSSSVFADSDISFDSGTDGDPFWVRCAPCMDRYVMVAWGHANAGSGGSTRIFAIVVDCNGSLPTLGTRYTIVDTKASTSTEPTYFDMVGSELTSDIGLPSWLIAYRFNDDLRVVRAKGTASGAPGWVWDVNPETMAGTGPSGISVLETNGNVWVNWYNENFANWRVARLATTTGATVAGPSVWKSLVATCRHRSSAIARWVDGSDTIELFASYQAGTYGSLTNPAVVDIAPEMSYRSYNTAGTFGSLRTKYGLRLWSKPWPDLTEKTWIMWCGALNVISHKAAVSSGLGVFGGDPVFTYTGVLMRFIDPAASVSHSRAQLVGTSGGSQLSLPYRGEISAGTSCKNAMTPQSVTHQLERADDSIILRLGRRTVLNYQYIPIETRGAPWEVTVRDIEASDVPEGYGRGRSAPYGGSTYFAGGVLSQFDGRHSTQNNYVKAPWIAGKMVTGGAAWSANYAQWAQKHLYLQAVYETVLENGERVRSATSPVLDILLNGTAGVTPPDCTVTVYLEPHVLMLNSTAAGANRYPRTIVTVYGSSEPDGQVLHRLFQHDGLGPTVVTPWASFVSDPDATGPITFTIDGTVAPYDTTVGSDGIIANLDRNEIIYNDSGELDNDHPFGGCTCLTVHKDRLWVGGGDDPELIWYSKERVDGRPAEFAIGQQIRIPSSKVIALASLDDALIVFCETAIFAVYGDGPNATGDPSSGLFTVVPISTTFGCKSASSVAVVPTGVIFECNDGLAMLTRARSVELVDAMKSTVETATEPRAVTVIPSRSEVRVMRGLQSEPSLTKTLIYAWPVNVWSTWEYQHEEGRVFDQAVLDDKVYILTEDGTIHLENENVFSDSGVAYRQRIQWGFLSFGRMLGYKRLYRCVQLLEPNPWADYATAGLVNNYPCGIRSTFDYNYSESGHTSVHEFSNYELGSMAVQDGITQVRMHLGKNRPSVRVTLEETSPTLHIISTDTNATVNTVGATVLKVRALVTDSYTSLTVTSGAARTKAQVVADLNTSLTSFGLHTYLLAYLDLSNRVVIQTIHTDPATGRGSYLQIDSTAGGSTLNTPLGFTAGGSTGATLVAATAQSGFVFQNMTFEVGHAQGPVRLSANQSR